MRIGHAVLLRLLPVVAVLAVAAGCGDDDTSPTAPLPGTVIFSFDHEVDGTPLVLEPGPGTHPYTNAAGNAYNVTFLQYFVSNLRLHQANGAVFGVDAAHFRDASDPSTRSYAMIGVPNGTYDAISFTFGLDAKTNVTGGLPTLELVWPPNWGGGYHYMEMNGFYDNNGNSLGYRTHTGRRFIAGAGDPSGEGPDSVAYHHFFEVYLPVQPFTVNANVWEVTAIMNINGWYENPAFDIASFFPTGAEGIMVNLLAQALLMENGQNNVYRVTGPVKQ